ncbi:hypothetical protein FRC03_004955 [Tulasnella sp. 419]|nr:hypothetical protein FRC03_004955 [Tulasnella sp. 419]
MDLLGTVCTSIEYCFKIKANFDLAGQNREECAALSTVIIESLTQIKEWLEHRSLAPPTELRDSLTQCENDLKKIFVRQQRLSKRDKSGVFGSSVSKKIKELYNAGDTKSQLDDLRQKIVICHQKLQLSSTVRTESTVADVSKHVIALRQDQSATDRKLDMLIEALRPSSNSMRMAALERIEERINDEISVIDNNFLSYQEQIRFRPAKRPHATSSVKVETCSLRSFSTSILEQRYLKCKVKELASALPQVREQAGRPRSLARFNPFREVAVWENEFHSNGTRADSIQETMRILTTLRSYKKIPSAEVARDLICLAKALGGFGMREESGVIFDWGIQICVEMAKNSSSRTLFSLAGFIHEVFLEIAIHGRMDDAARILNHLILVRRQLEEEDQRTHISKMATALRNTFYQLSGAGRLEASIKAGTEVVQSYRYLAEVDRDTYLGDLSLSLHELAIDLGKDGRHEDAVKAVEEAVNVQRELINQDTKTYLPKLADSLHTLATEMNGTGRREEAIRIAEEAVKMLQVFGERDRRNYSPCLSSSLRGLVAELQNKRQEEVVSVVEKEGVRPKAGEQVIPPPISNSDITVVEDQAEDDEEDLSITGPFSPPSRLGQLVSYFPRHPARVESLNTTINIRFLPLIHKRYSSVLRPHQE